MNAFAGYLGRILLFTGTDSLQCNACIYTIIIIIITITLCIVLIMIINIYACHVHCLLVSLCASVTPFGSWRCVAAVPGRTCCAWPGTSPQLKKVGHPMPCVDRLRGQATVGTSPCLLSTCMLVCLMHVILDLWATMCLAIGLALSCVDQTLWSICV